MNNSPIKLVVTDMDGTLLNSSHELPTDFFDVYEQLKAKGIGFIAASGRQYNSLVHYFDSIKDEIGFIAENGSYMVYKGEELFIDSIDIEVVHEVIDQVRSIPNAHLVLCTKDRAYIESTADYFVNEFKNYYYQSTMVDDLKEVTDRCIIKLAIYHAQSTEEFVYPHLKQFNNRGLKAVVSGLSWMDLMNENTNKGKALAELQDKIGISNNQTMVFGDYMNDLEMLQNTPHSFAMENAHAEVKKVARYKTASNNKNGVLNVLKTLTN